MKQFRVFLNLAIIAVSICNIFLILSGKDEN